MKGFFYKNVIELLRQYRWMLAMVVLFLVVGLSQKNAAYWGVYAEMVFGSFAGTLVRSDEVSGWNQYVRLLPISGKTAVSSFYIVPYLMMGVTTALYTIAALIIRAYSHGTYLIFPTVYLMIVLPFLITAITIPGCSDGCDSNVCPDERGGCDCPPDEYECGGFCGRFICSRRCGGCGVLVPLGQSVGE